MSPPRHHAGPSAPNNLAAIPAENFEVEETHPKGLMKFRADPVLRRAIRLRAAYEDVDHQDVIVAILTEALAEEIAEVRRRGIVPDPDASGGPKKSSRKKG